MNLSQHTILIDGNEYRSNKSAASYLNITHTQLNNRRGYDRILIKKGDAPIGPPWVKLNPGKHIYYKLTDLRIYRASLSTSASAEING